MKVLVLGGLGFVGSQLDQILENCDATILDNCLSGYIQTKHPFIFGDIRDNTLIQNMIPQYDIIVHLAGIVGAPACDINSNFASSINVAATLNTVKLLTANQKLIFISSTSAYGRQTEDVTENTVLAPLTSYGIHKALGESIVSAGKADFIILRPATAFGASKKVRVDLLPNTLAYTALTKGVIDLFEPHVIRPFIHVQDFAQIVAHAIHGNMPWNQIYNIGDPSLTIQKGQLATIIAESCGAVVQQRSGSDPDQRNYNVSFDKLLNTGYKFSMQNPLTVGVNDIRKWLSEIQQNYDSFCSPYMTQQFINKELGNGVFYQNNL